MNDRQIFASIPTTPACDHANKSTANGTDWICDDCEGVVPAPVERKTWTLLPNEDFACEAFRDTADGRIVHITIIPRLRDEQIAHYAAEGLVNVEADYQDFCRRFNHSPYSEVAMSRFVEFLATEDLTDGLDAVATPDPWGSWKVRGVSAYEG